MSQTSIVSQMFYLRGPLYNSLYKWNQMDPHAAFRSVCPSTESRLFELAL